MAFRELCAASGGQLGAYLEALMQLYQRVQGAGAVAANGAGVGGLALDEDDVQQVSPVIDCIADIS